MMKDMASFMLKVSSNASFESFWAQSNWPDLTPLKSESIRSMWEHETGENQAILIATGKEESPADIFAMLEAQTLTQGRVLIRRGLNLENPQFDILKSLQLSDPFVVLSIAKGQENSPTVLFKGSFETNAMSSWSDLRTALHNHKQSLSALSSNSDDRRSQSNESEKNEDLQHQHKEDYHHPVTVEAEIKRRRYTAYMSDLENAIIYSLSHEVGSRSSIVGPALDALREYTDVLDKHFPARDRPETAGFLHKLRNWVASHNDAIRGEDVIAEINDLRASTGAFADTPNGAWIGCRGSKPIFGGYPCSLWTLWHVLTVNQMNEEEPPYRVLEAMLGYIKHFFGCEDCTRHFLQVAEGQGGIRSRVSTKNDSILWLWQAHNKANQRLAGDLTDDKAFPKEIFPNRQHCSDCYTNRLGSDLWSEFNRGKILEFLQYLYGVDNLSGRGLRGVHRHAPAVHNQHEVAVYKEEEGVGAKKHNDYLREENERNSSFFWGPIDFSLCFSIYLLSAAILLVVYFKFIAKKNICYNLIYSVMSSKRNAPTNGLHGVV